MRTTDRGFLQWKSRSLKFIFFDLLMLSQVKIRLQSHKNSLRVLIEDTMCWKGVLYLIRILLGMYATAVEVSFAMFLFFRVVTERFEAEFDTDRTNRKVDLLCFNFFASSFVII